MIDKTGDGQTLSPGDVLSVWKEFYRHKGIYVGDGRVIAASREHGCVIDQTLEGFTEGQRLKNEGFPGQRSRESVVEAASSQIGRPYALFTDNCEHMVNEVHGLQKSSPQLQTAALAGLALVAVIALLRKRPVA